LQTRKVAANTGAAASSGCIACHQGARSFEGRDVDELAQRIHAVLQGEVRHPPLVLGDTSNEAIEQLAAELAGDQSAGS
ncbi:MAG: hypothetical protein KDI09_16230, partial [Halioglobus sp.]|nr:hypothetical protein [Halioglobus sp.]